MATVARVVQRWCKGGAKVVVSNGSDGRAPWKSQLRGLNEMENAIPNYASVWGYPACPVHPGHPLNIFSSPAFRLGCHRSHCWKPAAAAAGWRMKDEGRFRVSASFASFAIAHPAQQPSRPLFICVYNTTKSATLSLPPEYVFIRIFLPVPKTGLLGFRLWLWLPCRRDVYIYALLFPYVLGPFTHKFRTITLISIFLFFSFYFRFFWSWKSGISELLQLILDNIVASNCYKNHL